MLQNSWGSFQRRKKTPNTLQCLWHIRTQAWARAFSDSISLGSLRFYLVRQEHIHEQTHALLRLTSNQIDNLVCTTKSFHLHSDTWVKKSALKEAVDSTQIFKGTGVTEFWRRTSTGISEASGSRIRKRNAEWRKVLRVKPCTVPWRLFRRRTIIRCCMSSVSTRFMQHAPIQTEAAPPAIPVSRSFSFDFTLERTNKYQCGWHVGHTYSTWHHFARHQSCSHVP